MTEFGGNRQKAIIKPSPVWSVGRMSGGDERLEVGGEGLEGRCEMIERPYE